MPKGKLPQFVISLICIVSIVVAAAAVIAPEPSMAQRGAPGERIAPDRVAVAPSGPAEQDAQAPPVLLSSDPADGSAWQEGPVTLRFDQPMAAESAQFLQVRPSLEGTAAVDGANVIFTPSEPPVSGERYVFTLDTRAQSGAGTALNAPVTVTLIGALPLRISSTQPADGATDIDPTAELIVAFNRPVVELTGVDDQSELPQPLTIEPAVAGSGRWLNTSIYTFHPDTYWAGSTDYRVTVDGLVGLRGETLAEPQVFTFRTAAPAVLSVAPEGKGYNGRGVEPDSSVRVEFSQPMETEATASAFSLTQVITENGGTATPTEPVAGELLWENENATLVFTPTQWLDFGATYAVGIGQEAQAETGAANLPEAFRSEFSVVPLPAVESVNPEPGATGVDPGQSVVIYFNAPVSRTLVLENISVTPLLTTTQVYSYYADYANELTLSWFKEANTAYTVTIGAEVADPYGNTLGEDFVSTFTTGDYSAYVRTDLERFTHFSAFTDTLVSVLYRNIDSLDAELYQLPQSELFKLTGENEYMAWENYSIPDQEANRIWSRSYAPRAGENVTAQELISLTTDEGEGLAPGLYMLEMPRPTVMLDHMGLPDPNAVNTPLQHVIVLSNRNVLFKKSLNGESLAWITDLRTGEPVADAPVRFYQSGELLGESTTNADGIATVRLALDPTRSWVPVIAVTGEPGTPDFAVTSSEWYQGIGPWEFGINSGFGGQSIRTHFYTDRPIYRPGQTVYWKGIIRELVDDEYRLPPQDASFQVIIRDGRGNQMYTEGITPNRFGTVNGELSLVPEAPTGYYSIEISSLPNEIGEVTFYGSASFQVAAYRKPEFEISVTSDGAEYVHGDTMEFTVQADYFSGGPLANAPLTWRILSEPYFFNWEEAPADRYYSFTPYDPENDDYDPYFGFWGGVIHEGTATTDEAGRFTLELPADLSDAPQSQRWVFDATVQSSTNQFVSGRVSVPVHKSSYYVGISPQEYVVAVGEESTVDLVTVTPQGDPQPDTELTVIVQEFNWNSVYERGADGTYHWTSSVERRPVLTETVTTDDGGAAQLTWTPEAGGQYQIVALGAEEDVSSAAFVYASAAGDDFVTWRRDNNDRIELVADRDEYEPGDTARILVPSPFTGPVHALVTLERGGVLESRILTLGSNSETLEIPITAEHIPNIYVSVVLIKGVDATNPYPAMRVGNVQLNVDVAQKELAVDIEPSSQQVGPGDTISYTVTVVDSAGAPAPDVELSAALVDKAVLSLSEFAPQSLRDAFYSEQPLGVTTGALLVINRDRLNQQLTDGAKGGGGGGGGGLLEVREEFPDIAFWRAELVTDVNGQATFSVTLPDNLTTWELVARAVSIDTRVGEASNDVVATKALQIRPLLPRFFTAGDRARIGAVVVNASDGALSGGTLTAEIAGATVDAASADGTGTDFTFALDAGAQERFDLPITVAQNTSVVTFTFRVEAAGSGGTAGVPSGTSSLSDAVRIAVPVQRYATPETVATAGTVPPEGALESVRLPAEATEQGQLQVTLEPSLAAGMVDGLEYLEHYPYECNEQTVSRFLPNLFSLMAIRRLGVPEGDLASQLEAELSVGVQRLITRQNGDGGWGYWPGEESSPFITSYVLWGLWNANMWAVVKSHPVDYVVPQMNLDLAVEYLERQFVAPKDVNNDWQLNEMAFTHYVLAIMNRADPGRASTLYDVRERLAYYGQAYLAMALDAMQPEDAPDPRVTTLLDNLRGAADLTATSAHWSERTIDHRTLNTDVRSTAVVLAAFVRIQPDEPLLPLVVRWLMDAREAGHWSNTQENAWSIIALTGWLEASGELSADYDWTVTLNEDVLGEGSVNSSNLRDPVQLRIAVADLLRDESNLLAFARSNDSGQLYYTTHLRYYLDALAVDARDRGIVLDRRFELDGPVDGASVGDVISVTVTIIAPSDLYHVLVEAPLPAGTEAIDPNLATESDMYMGPRGDSMDESAPPWYRWQPTYTDIRDDKVAFFATFLPAGAYEYTFQVRATVPGEYRVLPVYGEQMYFNEVWGRSAGDLFTVRE